MSIEPNLQPGLTATIAQAVTTELTASRVGSGEVDVLATPMIVALVERAAVAAMARHLPEGRTSVGASVDLDHVAPTPVGATVTATARLKDVDGRRLSFDFEVSDASGVVARGTHVRVVVDRARFEASARARTEPPRP